MQSTAIQQILVPLDLSPFADSATACACSIAKRHHAQVEGMVVLDIPEIMGADIPYSAWMLPAGLKLSKERHQEAKKRIADAMAHFAAACEQRSVSHLEAVLQGVPADCILEAASLHDLVVMGLRTFFRPETSGEIADSLELVLDAPGAPVLAVPKHDSDPDDWKQVLIAFDGSANACRAVKEFARFAQPFDFQVTILTSSKDQAHGEATLKGAATYLRAHNISDIKTVVTDGAIHKVIDEEYIEDSDLVVAGIHSRRYIKDLFVGSLTRKLIEYGHTPLLLT